MAMEKFNSSLCSRLSFSPAWTFPTVFSTKFFFPFDPDGCNMEIWLKNNFKHKLIRHMQRNYSTSIQKVPLKSLGGYPSKRKSRWVGLDLDLLARKNHWDCPTSVPTLVPCELTMKSLFKSSLMTNVMRPRRAEKKLKFMNFSMEIIKLSSGLRTQMRSFEILRDFF